MRRDIDKQLEASSWITRKLKNMFKVNKFGSKSNNIVTHTKQIQISQTKQKQSAWQKTQSQKWTDKTQLKK